MESGQFLAIFSSWEVIIACLFIIVLLPLVFFVASARSPRRRVVLPVRPIPVRAAKSTRKSPAQAGDVEGEEPRPTGPRQRGIEPPESAGARE